MRIDAPSITGSFVVNNATLPDISGLATVSGNTFTGNQVINGTIVATGTTLVSGSAQVSYTGITNIPSGIVSSSAQTIANLPSGVVSGSVQTIANLPSGVVSGSAQVTTFGFGTTGSNTFQGTQTINGSLVVTGSLTAQQFIVSSSVTYLTESFASGSHKFGDSLDDNHNFTGSVYVSGSYTGAKYFSGGGMYVSTDTSYDTSRSYTFRDAMGISNPNGTSAATGTTVVSIGSMSNGVSLITTGYIGVKKNSANAELDVNGNAIISGSLTTTGDITVNSNGAIFNRTSSGEPYLFFRKDGVNRGSIYGISGGGLRMFDQSDNQVFTMTGSMIGISNTTPSAKLDIYAGSSTSAVLWGQTIRNEGNGATTNYGAGLKLKVSSDGTPNEIYKWAGVAGVAGTNYSNRTDLAFYTAASSTADATEKVRIDGNGIMGINTISPGLQTNGIGMVISSNTTQFPVLRLERVSGGGGGKTVTNWEWVINSSGGLTLQNQSDAYEPFVMENTTGILTLTGDVFANKSMNVARYNRINNFYEYVKDGPYTSSAATVSVIRQFHDAANWCNGGILVEITCHGYATSEFDHAIYFVRYGYGGNSIAIDTRMSPITNRITAPYWGSAINISGNDYYRDLFFDTQAYRSYKIVLKTSMAPTTNSTGAGQGNYVYLFGY
jgi:hypothetical protein